MPLTFVLYFSDPFELAFSLEIVFFILWLMSESFEQSLEFALSMWVLTSKKTKIQRNCNERI